MNYCQNDGSTRRRPVELIGAVNKFFYDIPMSVKNKLRLNVYRLQTVCCNDRVSACPTFTRYHDEFTSILFVFGQNRRSHSNPVMEKDLTPIFESPLKQYTDTYLHTYIYMYINIDLFIIIITERRFIISLISSPAHRAALYCR